MLTNIDNNIKINLILNVLLINYLKN